MNRKTVASLDETYGRLQWAGYTYRYWHYYTGKSSKEMYAIANAERMATVYPGFHTLDVKMAIDRLKGQ